MRGLSPGRRKLLLRLLALGAIMGAYPAAIVGFTWSHVWQADFQGGRNGPLDAYRHGLASAAVAYTLGDWAVDLVSATFEWSGTPANQMDRHNNRLGAAIGSKAASWTEIEPAVRAAVRAGTINAQDAGQFTWLAPDTWRNRRAW